METTANIFIIISNILFGTTMYYYLHNRRNKNKLKTANSLLKSEESRRIKLESDINEIKNKLKFAINNPPKFKVGDKIKNVIVESIELEKTKTKWAVPILTGIICGLVAGLNSYKEENKNKFYYKYKFIHKDYALGQKLTKETEVLTEEDLLKLKQHKTKA